MVQLDEPSLPAVLAGRLRTSSGYGAHRALDREVVTRGLREVVAGARGVRSGVVAGDRARQARQSALDWRSRST